MTLDPEDIEAIADLVVRKLRDLPTGPELVDVTTLARILGVSTDYVYEHARRLGGIKAGTGPKARWRFNAQAAMNAFKGEDARPAPKLAAKPAKRRGRPPKQPARTVDLIPLRP